MGDRETPVQHSAVSEVFVDDPNTRSSHPDKSTVDETVDILGEQQERSGRLEDTSDETDIDAGAAANPTDVQQFASGRTKLSVFVSESDIQDYWASAKQDLDSLKAALMNTTQNLDAFAEVALSHDSEVLMNGFPKLDSITAYNTCVTSFGNLRSKVYEDPSDSLDDLLTGFTPEAIIALHDVKDLSYDFTVQRLQETINQIRGGDVSLTLSGLLRIHQNIIPALNQQPFCLVWNQCHRSLGRECRLVSLGGLAVEDHANSLPNDSLKAEAGLTSLQLSDEEQWMPDSNEIYL